MALTSKRRSKYKPVEKTFGYCYNQRLPYYREDRNKKSGSVFIVARDFYQKAVCRAIENDFGFTTNGTIDRKSWDARGIKFVKASRRNMVDYYKWMSKNTLGNVFIVCSPLRHRPAIYLDRNRHLVLLVPHIHHGTWPHLKIFKQAADYLNIDIDFFRPD